ncbi:hypothetical protein [Roseateles chitosanitabidus]|jgi:hypothetical protein|uniref:hypothetical protein n=1 Tax=Roseateles chitosanitabidus TaxID=65048 RepID=UPI0008318A13|nr:hypothetical protein [Roseateles chitosanitabidus]MBO9686284.1 hypothetical protein [Roseateles chitosanitabidus]
MNTIRCYDRFATIKRIAALVGVTTGIAAGLLLALPARAAQPQPQVQKLPTVVISGKSTRTVAANEVRSLPTVVVTGRRAIDGQQVAAR